MSGSAIKKRDYSVEFWRFIFTLGIAMSHFQMLGIGPGRFWGEALKGGKIDLTGVFTLFGTGRFICFFMLITGYFMMAAFQKQKTLGMVEKIEPHRAAWNYLKGRYKALWPAFFVGTLFGFIINCLLDPEIASLKDALIYLGSMVYVFAGVETSGITGNVGVLNGATWYISSIFVTALPLYYLIWKNEKAFKGWIAPFIFLIVWGYFGLAGEPINPFAKNVLSYGFFETSWLVAFATFCFGAMLWYPIERLKNKELTGFQQGLVNIVAILIVAALLKAVVVRGYYRDETVVMFFMAIFIVFMLSGKDCISKVLGKVSFFGKLGKFSLYLYVMHFPLCRAFPVYYEVTAANYYTSLAMFVLVLFVFAFIGMFVTEKLLRPFLGAIIGKKETQAA